MAAVMPRVGQAKAKSANQSAKATLMPKGSKTTNPKLDPAAPSEPMMESEFVERAFVKEVGVAKNAKVASPTINPTVATPLLTSTKSPVSQIGIAAQTSVNLSPPITGPVGPSGPAGPQGMTTWRLNRIVHDQS